MKVGILTFHNTINYGATLQAFALYKTVKKIAGNDVEIINYHSDYISKEKRLLHMLERRDLKAFVHRFSTVPFEKNRGRLFEEFVDKQMKLSQPLDTREKLKSLANCYDVVITGSDQIFNLSLTHKDFSYFLDFMSDKKIKVAYAASVGNYSIDKLIDGYGGYLENIDYLSFREQSTLDKMPASIKNRCNYVLDPTFLLSKDEWISYVDSFIDVPKEYILVYFVSPNKTFLKYAREVGKKIGLPIVYIPYNAFDIHLRFDNKIKCSPMNFIQLINGASMIITNSYHGTILSLNFEKEVRVLYKERNKRVEDILGKLRLMDCLQRVDKDFEMKKLDYSEYHTVIEKLRGKSEEYLKWAIDVENN